MTVHDSFFLAFVSKMVCVTINSGKTIHLVPQQVSEQMEEIEIEGNQKLGKMKKNSPVTVEGEKKGNKVAVVFTS